MSKHTITAEIEVSFHLLGAPDDERESARPKIEIAYTFSPGTPERRYQRNGDPGWPAEAAEIEFVSAKLIDGDGLDPSQDNIDHWAEDWLNDKGYDRAAEQAGDDNEPDPDYERERFQEDARDSDMNEGDY